MERLLLVGGLLVQYMLLLQYKSGTGADRVCGVLYCVLRTFKSESEF